MKQITLKRQPNIELLRMLAMLSIVLTHMMSHGNVLWTVTPHTADYYLSWILFSFGIHSINTYLLISGYFMVDQRFSSWRLARMAGQIIFYSLGITLLFWIFFGAPHEAKYMIYSVLPITSDFYWYASLYAGLCLLSPLINKLIRALTKNQLKWSIVLLLALLCVWPTIAFFSSSLNVAGGVSIAWFVPVYMIGAYIKLYYVPSGKWKLKLLISFIMLLMLPGSRFLIEWMLTTPLNKIPMLEDLMWGYSLFYNYNSILVTATAIVVFITFVNMKINAPRLSYFINVAAGCSFGVYLIHDHYYVREFLWKFIKVTDWIGKWYLVPMALGCMLLIYLVGMIIEFLRQKLFSIWEKDSAVKRFFLQLDQKLLEKWHE